MNANHGSCCLSIFYKRWILGVEIELIVYVTMIFFFLNVVKHESQELIEFLAQKKKNNNNKEIRN